MGEPPPRPAVFRFIFFLHAAVGGVVKVTSSSASEETRLCADLSWSPGPGALVCEQAAWSEECGVCVSKAGRSSVHNQQAVIHQWLTCAHTQKLGHCRSRDPPDRDAMKAPQTYEGHRGTGTCSTAGRRRGLLFSLFELCQITRPARLRWLFISKFTRGICTRFHMEICHPDIERVGLLLHFQLWLKGEDHAVPT